MSLTRHECYEASNPGAIFVFVVHTPCMVACIVTTVLFWYNYHYGQSDDLKSTRNVIKTSIAEKQTKDSKFIQKIGGTTLILYSVFVLLVFVSFLLEVSMDCPDISVWFLIIGSVAYFSGFVGVVTLFTYRIRIAFENTKYEVSSRLLTIFKIIGVCVIVLLVSVSILRVTNVISPDTSAGILLFAVLLLLFYCLVLLRLFLSKLNGVINDFGSQFGKLSDKQLITLQRSNSGSFDAQNSDFLFSTQTNGDGNGNGSENDRENVQAGAPDGTNTPYVNRLINDISELKIKYTLMVIIALVSSLFFLVLAIMSIRVVKINGPYRLEAKVMTSIMSIDSFVNCLCLFLQFDFSHNLYKKLCLCCHNKCQDRYTNKANKELIKSGHGNMQLKRTNSQKIRFESNTNNINSDEKKKENVETMDIVYNDENKNNSVAMGHKILTTFQA